MTADRVDVLIVGAGPTGLLLAGHLAAAGVPVTVLERDTGTCGRSGSGTAHARLREALAERARAAGAQILQGMEVTGLRPANEGAHVQARGAAGKVRTFAPSFVVGADGARSTVREMMSMPRQVAVFRSGPVFLAGDAARAQRAAGRPGMRAGLHDAASLSRKLAAVARHGADPSLLDSYQSERHPGPPGDREPPGQPAGLAAVPPPEVADLI